MAIQSQPMTLTRRIDRHVTVFYCTRLMYLRVVPEGFSLSIVSMLLITYFFLFAFESKFSFWNAYDISRYNIIWICYGSNFPTLHIYQRKKYFLTNITVLYCVITDWTRVCSVTVLPPASKLLFFSKDACQTAKRGVWQTSRWHATVMPGAHATID